MDVGADFLSMRTARATNAGYPKARWIGFCETMLGLGYSLKMYEVERSKYITVFNLGRSFKVRFSWSQSSAPARELRFLRRYQQLLEPQRQRWLSRQ